MDFLGRVLTIFIAILLIIIFPLQYIAQSYETDIDSIVDTDTKEFTDEIRDKGYLDVSMYENFVKDLATSGELYNIEIEDINPVTGADISKANIETNLTKETLDVTALSVSPLSQKLSFNGNGPELASLSSDLGEIQSLATHTHTDDCYAGHRHIGSCYSYVGNRSVPLFITLQGVNVEHHWDYDLNYYSIGIRCNQCRTYLYDMRVYDYTGRMNNEDYFNLSNTIYLNDGTLKNDGVRWTRLYKSVSDSRFDTIMSQSKALFDALSPYCTMRPGYAYPCAIDFVIPASLYLIFPYVSENAAQVYQGCPTCGGPNPVPVCGQVQDENPICNQVVTSITATKAEQTVRLGGAIDPTAAAIFLDGHPGSVMCTSNFNSNQKGVQTVTLTYSGKVGNAKTTGTLACTVKVTVIADELKSISVLPTNITVEKYIEANNLPITVMAQYQDGSSKAVTGYTINNYNPSILGLQLSTVSYTEAGVTKTAPLSITLTRLHNICSVCRKFYELNYDDTDPGCPFCKGSITGISVMPDYLEVSQGNSLPITVQASFADGSMNVINSWTSNYEPDKIGIQNVTIEYGGFFDEVSVFVKEATTICPICHTEYPITDGKCPLCSETVISIRVAPSSITVNRYDNINLLIDATYADGSTRSVTEWSIDKTTSEEGTFIATVSYENVTTTITLTVLPMSIIVCPICGQKYDKGDNPNGCPICSITLTGMEAYPLSGSNLVQYGTNPNLAIVLIFRDNHREAVMSDYTIEGYSPYHLGKQTITVKYSSYITTLEIEVINTLAGVTCPNRHVYYLNEDGSDPGCPYCIISNEQDVSVYFFDITYTAEILETIYRDGIYYFEDNHYLTIRVTKKDKSLLFKIQKTSLFKLSILGRKKRYIYGGKVFS